MVDAKSRPSDSTTSKHIPIIALNSERGRSDKSNNIKNHLGCGRLKKIIMNIYICLYVLQKIKCLCCVCCIPKIERST